MGRVFFVLVLFLVWALPAQAWHTNTHYQMTKDAISLMPPELQKILVSNKKFVEAGIKDPDEMIRDWQNHYYIPSEPPEGGGIDRVEKIIKIVQTKLQGGNQLDVGKQLCYLAHYIADLWNPEKLIKGDVAQNLDFVQNENIVVLFEGYEGPIENYREYFVTRSQWRWRLENTPEVSRILYSEAVNDIARIWLSLWQQSGKTTEPVAAGVIEHKKGALTINFARLLVEEEYTWEAARAEQDWKDGYVAHYKEVDRLKSNVDPNPRDGLARAEIRNQEQWMNRVSPTAPFKMLETSLKTVGDKTYLVARFRNKSEKDIPSIAFMYPGVKGPAALVTNVRAGEVIKIQAALPPNAQREKIQMIFSSPEEEAKQ
ncbi:hypothetical protein L0156_26080 [bacterium]|nr:hypothetical protein [bacterium]